MTNKNKNKIRDVRTTDTRDAVETAIDISKEDKSSSWEHLISTRRVKRWGVKDPNEQQIPQPTIRKAG
jgi:hypothetical protein